MTITTTYQMGQRIGYKKRSPTWGYMFMVGPVTAIKIEIDESGQKERYRMRFEKQPKGGAGWRNWFEVDEIEAVN